MSTSKKINVSDAFHKHLEEECQRLKLPYKEYLEAAGTFFISRRIDPREYEAGQAQDLSGLLRQAIEKIFAFLVFQEKHILKEIHTEASKSRIMGELAVNHLLTLLSEDASAFQKLQQKDQQYLSDRLKQAVEQFNTQG